ncbi:hypothetical protein MAR_036291 [Mya arenaria]|uniref:Uncharacterized protein n=1 Tax=Mya arenaria TaxID=6604 RepID=A0ABY7EPN6_MYAAR|nr:hypothetical protein MAR_036291 [Mya arenaria]
MEAKQNSTPLRDKLRPPTSLGPDDTIGTARMYAQPGDCMCPVTNIRTYLRKLPDSVSLRQKAQDSFALADVFWYRKSPLYANHCIRATSIATLDSVGFEASMIIRATGHKYESSKSYSPELSEIDLPTPSTEIVQANSTVQSPASVTTNYRIDHHMNVA